MSNTVRLLLAGLSIAAAMAAAGNASRAEDLVTVEGLLKQGWEIAG